MGFGLTLEWKKQKVDGNALLGFLALSSLALFVLSFFIFQLQSVNANLTFYFFGLLLIVIGERKAWFWPLWKEVKGGERERVGAR